jgi:hypothetical protein
MRRLLLISFILIWVYAAFVAANVLTSKINDSLNFKSSATFAAAATS